MANSEQPLVVRSTDTSDSAIFERFFAGYDRAFVLPDEKEDRDGLAECLALNHGAEHERLTGVFGPFRELCLIAERQDGSPVGGANFIAMPAASFAGTAPTVTANLNYVYVDPEARRSGNLRRMLQAVMESAATLFQGSHGPLRPLVFIEQNDPFRMSDESYESDTRFTGIDQLDRLRIWARLAARVIDFPYVQPALSEDQQADDNLIYSVLGCPAPSLAPQILHGHLECFFGISVLKGRPIGSDPAAAAQLARLEAMVAADEAVTLLDPGPLLDRLAGRDQAAALLGGPPESFREAVAEIVRRSGLAPPSG